MKSKSFCSEIFASFDWAPSNSSEPCKPFSPLQPSKTPETPNLSEICPSDCFWGFQSGGLKFGKICQNLSENYRFSNFDKFFQISVPLTGTPKNNRWDKFRTNLGFRAFLKAVRGKRVLNQSRNNPAKNAPAKSDCRVSDV